MDGYNISYDMKYCYFTKEYLSTCAVVAKDSLRKGNSYCLYMRSPPGGSDSLLILLTICHHHVIAAAPARPRAKTVQPPTTVEAATTAKD